MERTSTASTSNVSRGLRAFRSRVASAVAALHVSERSLEGEVRALVEPHLPVLTHKRRKFFGEDEREHELWAKELDAFVIRTFFWPTPATTEAFAKCDRRKIGAMVDRIVAADSSNGM